MPRKTQKESARTRKRIIESALDLFSKRGYEKTTFSHIAEKLKMTKGAVFWHFPTKEKLLEEICSDMLENFSNKFLQGFNPAEMRWPVIKKLLIHAADELVRKPRERKYYRLMQSQIRWADDSMTNVREQLLSKSKSGPVHALRCALQNERAHGMLRKDADDEATIVILMSMWDGLLRSVTDGFAKANIRTLVELGFDSVWKSISIDKKDKEQKENARL